MHQGLEIRPGPRRMYGLFSPRAGPFEISEAIDAVIQIGPYRLANRLLLAPMAGITDLPFRRLCRGFGAGLAVSEMIASDTTLRAQPKTLRRLDFSGEPGPIAVQILGADPQTMAEAARINADHGAQIIDINMGCPAKKVCRVAAGSALLRDEILAGRILEAVVRAAGVPVTLKIRTGWDPANRNALRIACIAEAAGIQALAVHGRTRACGFSGEAEYATIQTIKQAVKIPVIANGDIRSPEKAARVLELTGADGIMIGRAARGRPWLFREIAEYLETGRQNAPARAEAVYAVLREHLEALHGFYGERRGMLVARKHIAWYSKRFPGGAVFRQKINQISEPSQQLAAVESFFHRLGDMQELAA